MGALERKGANRVGGRVDEGGLADRQTGRWGRTGGRADEGGHWAYKRMSGRGQTGCTNERTGGRADGGGWWQTNSRRIKFLN